jgi:hypothetical protein
MLSKELEKLMCNEVCIRLSKGGRYDYSELLKELGYGESRKEDEIKKSIMLPWCGKVIEGNCESLKYNSGLYTQCMKKKEEGIEVCMSCKESIERNGGDSVYGTVKDRLSCGLLDYKDGRGKKCVRYLTIMKREKISREDAEMAAREMGWEIDKCNFESSVGKRGRPRKERVESESEVVEKKKRGRPRKSKEVVSSNVGEDLIASLMSECVEEVQEVEVDVEVEEEEETSVEKFEYDGKMYLRSGENMLFDIDSHEAVGMWNESDNKIDELEEE